MIEPTTRAKSRRCRVRMGATVAAAMALVASTPAIGTARAEDGADSRHGDRPWESYILAPESRTVRPTGVFKTEGQVENPEGAFGAGAASLAGQDSLVTLDFGVNVAGLVSIDFGNVEGEPIVGLAFAETSRYVEKQSEASTGGPRGRDGTVLVTPDADGTWTAPPHLLRGAFRYLTLFLVTDGAIELDDVTLEFTASPLMDDLRAYPNYFYSSDDMLNRLWYAGAYTVQLTTIDPTTGRVWDAPPELWDNSAVIGVGQSILVDGAKRDRTVWPGDLGISIGTAYVSTGDTVSARNSLQTMYNAQRDTGELPYAGPQISFYGSDTYHLWTLIATAEYVRYSADHAWLASIWDSYRAGMDFILDKMGPRGLLHITGTNDTTHGSRIPQGEELMANVMLWRALTTGAELATTLGDQAYAGDLQGRANDLANAINEYLWNEEVGAYRWYPDRDDVYPQGGNAMAVWWGLASGERAVRISEQLRTNWIERGATTPERDGDLQMLFGSIELQAQLATGSAEAELGAVDLMKRQWGYMLEHPQGPQSTTWESLRASGEIVSSYQSYAHGWSTGPTRALTNYVLGVNVTSDGGDTWIFDPRRAGLEFVKGRLATTHGPIDAAWEYDAARHVMTMEVSGPKGTTGRIGVPTYGKDLLVHVDGELVWNGRNGLSKGFGAHLEGDRLYLDGVPGGRHEIIARELGLR